MMNIHFGRSWGGHRIEDECPCTQETCGLVARADPDCEQHGWRFARTMRQGHPESACPGIDGQGDSAMARAKVTN